MRVALLFPNNLFTSPYLKYYTDILKQEKIEYDLLIWDRANIEEEGCIAFKCSENSKSTISKALDFIRFRKFLIKNLKNKNYSKVIVFSGQVGILMGDFLIKHYSKRYLLDVRDFSQPMKYFKSRFIKVVLNSNFVCISSNGFKNWLPPKGDYLLGHNIDISLVRNALSNFPFRDINFDSKTIKISTIGQIKDFNSDALFIDQLKNDSRFEIEFIGFGPALNDLKNKTNSEHIANINYKGPYKKYEEPFLLKDSDFINILISRTEFNKGATLLSNRLYLSAMYNIPCIVNKNTEQSRIIEKYNFGIIVDKYEELPDKLMTYKDSFCKENFLNNCYNFLNDVKTDYSLFEQKVTNFLTDK
ncbi:MULTISPECIES: hypothetical protein [unclassified Arenibacter]|uniref:hypothetical protein n=1 Tax=unclassified Arenibacter TaxID=2615047 RepID=UPI000E3482AB|nr:MULTISPECIES: hypothetical protein [unclassified Arenibacter]MCM4164779.1 hypothetical protein [Arenibacter sp. A80]RFT55846.1 hypothetical protein D0S24_14330 [Arenibacter sp. P308M17]